MKNNVFIIFFSVIIILTSYDTLLAKDWGKGYVNDKVKSILKGRRKPNPKTNVVIKVPKNTYVGIKYNHDSWYKIRYEGKLGWVPHKYITVTEKSGDENKKIKKEDKPMPSYNKSANNTKVLRLKDDIN